MDIDLSEDKRESWLLRPTITEGPDAYSNEFLDADNRKVYIFALYWIWEVFSTVGYGDYFGTTEEEYVFSMILELIGLTFFSLLMGLISGFILDLNEGFEEMFQRKMEYLIVWVNKIEKSKKDNFINRKLYLEMIRYVEDAFLYDFNMIVEDFNFYQQLTPSL